MAVASSEPGLEAALTDFAFKASNIGYWVWDRETGQVHLSEACFKMLQLSQADFSHNIEEIKSLIHPDDYDILKTSLDTYIENEIGFELGFRVKRSDNSYISVTLAGQADDDKSKSSQRVGGSIMDSSAEVSLKQQLDQERQNLRLIFDNVPVRIWLKDSHNTILRLNKGAAESMNMSVLEVEGANTYDLFPEQARAYHEADLAVIKSGRPLGGIVEKFTPKNGPHGWVRTDKLPFTHPETNEKFVLVIATDITKQIEYENEILDTAANLVQANKDLDHFAYISSHDLKAPLRGMDDLAKWIAEDLGDNITPDIQEKIDLLRGRVSRMESLLKDILAFSRAGKNMAEPEEVDFEAVVDEVIDWISPPDGFNIVRDTALPTLIAPKSVTELVTLNLVSNAIKHHDRPEGTIRIGYEGGETHHLYYVSDDGPGIPEKYHKHVFEIFKKLTPRDHVEGSGMGLAIVKKMTQALGGKIEILSEDGKRGTTFNVYIPKIKS